MEQASMEESKSARQKSLFFNHTIIYHYILRYIYNIFKFLGGGFIHISYFHHIFFGGNDAMWRKCLTDGLGCNHQLLRCPTNLVKGW